MNPRRLFYEFQNQCRAQTRLRQVSLKAKGTKHTPENIHLFTHARGGSTALAEAIGRNKGCPILWEPFFKGRRPFREFDHRALWGWKEYIESEAEFARIDDYFERLINRTYLHPRFFTGQSIRGLAHNGPLVYKYCHANLMAPYLIRRFNLKAVILDRHVGQLIASRKRYGGFFKGKRTYKAGQQISKHSRAVFDLHKEHRPEAIRSDVGIHAWDYCLIRTLRNQINSPNVLHLEFNEMILNPEKVANKLNIFLDTTLSPSDFSPQSRVSVEPTSNPKDYLKKWRKRLTHEEILEIRGIVHDVFGMRDIDLSM